MGDACYELDHVSKVYQGQRALDDVTISFERGEIYGLIGENGAGKSTLIRILLGLARPTSGTVSLFGQSAPRAFREGLSRVGYVPDECSLYLNMSARQNLEVRCTEWGLPAGRAVDAALERVGLADVGGKRVRAFSFGMRQRLSLAVAMLGDPEVLVLDEPINGLDPRGALEVGELLRELCAGGGRAIVVSSHILSELERVATRYVLMSRGAGGAHAAADSPEVAARGGLEGYWWGSVGGAGPR